MHRLFANFGSRQRGVLPPTPSTRKAATHTTSTCALPLYCLRASKLGFESSCSGHDEGRGVDDHSCHRRYRRRRQHTGRGETTNDEEGACRCYHVGGRRAEEGGGAVVLHPNQGTYVPRPTPGMPDLLAKGRNGGRRMQREEGGGGRQ